MPFAIAFQLFFVTLGYATDITLSHGGRIKGTTQPTGANGNYVYQFLGIPYARPPTGDLRFQKPKPAEPWTADVLDCTQHRSICPQPTPRLGEDVNLVAVDAFKQHVTESEDCLTLNVWQPYHRETNLPVMVWIHGGSFFEGSSALDVYNGGILASEQKVIVVSMNYRLGFIGFFSLGSEGYMGNHGLHDQRLALQWVQDNIHKFGGDPKKVTIFGESAGGASVSLHGASPENESLFRYGIIESGNLHAPFWAWKTNAEVQAATRKVTDDLGCKGDPSEVISCLKGKSTDEIRKAADGHLAPGVCDVAFIPTVDGDLFKTYPNDSKVSNFEAMIIGGNTNEGNQFAAFAPGLSDIYDLKKLQAGKYALETESDFQKAFNVSISDFWNGNELAKTFILHEYSAYPTTQASWHDIIDKILGDYYVFCPTRNEAEWLTDNGVNVFMYEFNHTWPGSGYPDWMGSQHMFEIPYIFGVPLNERTGLMRAGQREKRLSETIMEYIGNFAKTGNPNLGPRRPRTEWPQHSNQGEDFLRLTADKLGEHDTAFRGKQCRFWKEVYPVVSSQEKCSGNSASTPKMAGKLMLCLLFVVTAFQ